MAGLARKGSLVKILGNGEIDKKLQITADAASAGAIAAVEKAGGSLTINKRETAAEKWQAKRRTVTKKSTKPAAPAAPAETE